MYVGGGIACVIPRLSWIMRAPWRRVITALGRIYSGSSCAFSMERFYNPLAVGARRPMPEVEDAATTLVAYLYRRLSL
jgi:hypothetical protein